MDLQRFQNPGHNMSFGIQSDGASKNNKNEKNSKLLFFKKFILKFFEGLIHFCYQYLLRVVFSHYPKHQLFPD